MILKAQACGHLILNVFWLLPQPCISLLQVCPQQAPAKWLGRPLPLQAGLGQKKGLEVEGLGGVEGQGWSGAGGYALLEPGQPTPALMRPPCLLPSLFQHLPWRGTPGSESKAPHC